MAVTGERPSPQLGERPRDVARRMVRDGTPAIAAGSLLAGLAAYAFQVLGGRTLGDEGFAPVAALLSVHSLILAVLLTPVELLTVRRLTLTRGGAAGGQDRRSIAVTVAAAVAVMVGFVAASLDRYFRGSEVYVVVGAAVVGSHALFALGRGWLAGMGRYVAYGVVSGAAAVVRVVLVAVWMQFADSDLAFAWAVALPPLIVLAWRPFRRELPVVRAVPRPGSGSLMAGFVLAGAISQVFVLVGPLVAGVLVRDPAQVARTVSVVFVTFSLARAPLLLAQNLAARLLAGLTRLVAVGASAELRAWSRRLGIAGLLAAPLGFLGGVWLAPPLIAALFGEAFRPHPTAAGLAVAGCMVAAASVFLDQVLVALGATGKLAGAWTAALGVAAVTLLVTGGTAEVRVATAVAVGELAALLGVLIAGELAVPESPDSGYDLAKRAFDLVAGGVLLLLALPVLGALAVAVRLDSPGPVLFRQPRVGKNDRLFTMVKFRTMEEGAGDEPLHRHLAQVAQNGYVHPDAAAEGPRLWIDDDPRLTRVGRFLRRTSLDELPNLWNVVRGHISLVGPRPLVPAEVELLGPEARARHRVRPGLTGLAQVMGGSEITYGARAFWDLQYVERRSLLLDLRILARTPLAALRRPA